MEATRESMAALLDAGLFGSAQTLGSFLVSSAGVSINEAGMSMRVESLVLHGDALYGEKEFRRALSSYKQAMLCSRSIPKQAASNTRSSVSTTGRSPSPNSSNLLSFNENEVKFKIALCHSALREHREALIEMEGIPSKVRTLKMNLMLGKLYRISRNTRSAAVCYKECLRQCPYVFEAITALAELGLSLKEFSLLFSQVPNRGKLPASGESADAQRWWNRYVEAQCCIAQHDYRAPVTHALSEPGRMEGAKRGRMEGAKRGRMKGAAFVSDSSSSSLRLFVLSPILRPLSPLSSSSVGGNRLCALPLPLSVPLQIPRPPPEQPLELDWEPPPSPPPPPRTPSQSCRPPSRRWHPRVA